MIVDVVELVASVAVSVQSRRVEERVEAWT